MSLTISIRFLTGRAHLHPWQAHHSEGLVEWPPSQWRLLRAIVSVAGRGLTSLPQPDFVSRPGNSSSLPDRWHGEEIDQIPLSRLSQLLEALATTPTIWLPRTGGGHTRQYLPIHKGGVVRNTGAAVFDTFATLRRDQPLLFHWSSSELESQRLADLRLLLSRMSYFGRAESWCLSQAHTCKLEDIGEPGMDRIDPGRTHWECVCIDDGSHPRPEGKEYRDYLLERRLAPVKEIRSEVAELMPRTRKSYNKRPEETEFRTTLLGEPPHRSLLRCLLRESGQDIKDGLERPIGTRWVHYAVPRSVYDIPKPAPRRPRPLETTDLVRYALNTAASHRPVLPSLTDTLLIADRFRSAAMAVCRIPSRALSGHEADGTPCKGYEHAFWWPFDEDNDGFIDHVMVWAPGGFGPFEIDALRRLTRIRQRGGRPDLLVSPTYVGKVAGYKPWTDLTNTFVSATPYFCPLHLANRRSGRGRLRPITKVILDGLRQQGVVEEGIEISEIVFDHVNQDVGGRATRHSGQHAPASRNSQAGSSSLPVSHLGLDQFQGAHLKDPDTGFPFGLSVGLRVEGGTRFIHTLNFCRRRRNRQLNGQGRMLMIRFPTPRESRPFALGEQCHFGLGLFVPVTTILGR